MVMDGEWVRSWKVSMAYFKVLSQHALIIT